MATKRKITQNDIYESLSALSDGITAVQETLARREHIDIEFQKQKELLDGNGKPGFLAIRDKVSKWETTINGLMVLVAGDIILRIVGWVFVK